jgi:hypothetical protein
MDIRKIIIQIILLFTLISLIGCASIGTIILPKTRQGFNGAMITSDEQQLLLNLVRLQFEDRPFFLSVESITASNSFSMSSGASANLGPQGTGSVNKSFDRLANLTSFTLNRALGLTQSYGLTPSTSLGDNPTISYSPLQGEKFTKQILSKLSLNTIFLLLNSGWNIDRVLRSFADQIGDYTNVSVVSSQYLPEYKQFVEVVEYMQELYEQKIISYDLSEITSITIDA